MVKRKVENTVNRSESESENMAEADDRFVYTINGVKVVFPCKAYPTQLSMMNMVGILVFVYGLFS